MAISGLGAFHLEILPFHPRLVGRAKVNTADLVGASLGGKGRLENVPSPAPPLRSSVHGGAQDAFPSPSPSDAPETAGEDARPPVTTFTFLPVSPLWPLEKSSRLPASLLVIVYQALPRDPDGPATPEPPGEGVSPKPAWGPFQVQSR